MKLVKRGLCTTIMCILLIFINITVYAFDGIAKNVTQLQSLIYRNMESRTSKFTVTYKGNSSEVVNGSDSSKLKTLTVNSPKDDYTAWNWYNFLFKVSGSQGNPANLRFCCQKNRPYDHMTNQP